MIQISNQKPKQPSSIFILWSSLTKRFSNHNTYIKQKNSTTRISKTFSKSTNLMLLEMSTNSNPSDANSNPSDAKRTSIHSLKCNLYPQHPSLLNLSFNYKERFSRLPHRQILVENWRCKNTNWSFYAFISINNIFFSMLNMNQSFSSIMKNNFIFRLHIAQLLSWQCKRLHMHNIP